ncbi:rod shape-determining protein MreC [Altibacter sp. HG106]|uniref:rod shape-determining protein MreC n=1 Tax=Altibacter sp. HG106 TaxID=3023937 RepID=UPI0023504E04|nr:rod shape-determining protein MreC [Altibacter sp. HG106]MDC7994290.1 rod shape-determining protein MreC [Altibacter sp. HG106]
MQQILFFFIRNKNFLLFVILFAISFFFTVQSHSYHNNKFMTSANFFSGGVYTIKSGITDYFGLEDQNALLLEENRRLRQLLGSRIASDSSAIDSLPPDGPYAFASARVINNYYAKTKNHITIDKGRNDGLEIDMGVISSQGVVGIVSSVSANYATVQSILNTESQINAKLEKSGHFGTVVWEGKNPSEVTLIDIPRIAPVAEGDIVVTGGRSTIFPEGILVGTVATYQLAQGESYYDLTVTLFNDMTNLDHVYIIENRDLQEIRQLETTVEDAE